MVTVYVRAEVF